MSVTFRRNYYCKWVVVGEPPAGSSTNSKCAAAVAKYGSLIDPINYLGQNCAAGNLTTCYRRQAGDTGAQLEVERGFKLRVFSFHSISS